MNLKEKQNPAIKLKQRIVNLNIEMGDTAASGIFGLEIQGATAIFVVNLKRILKILNEKEEKGEEEKSGKNSRLTSHIAKTNPRWKTLNNKDVLAVFSGPHFLLFGIKKRMLFQRGITLLYIFMEK